MQQVREIARQYGLASPARSTKLHLIRSIQSTEGNFPCYASALEMECDQLDCLWRRDCFAAAKKMTA